jgi:NADPH:quinone reductase-like Zn-dependent oxidoreductase
MRAVTLIGHGGNEVVALSERPVPVRRPGEVLVGMRAGGLNRVDLYMRNSGAGITHALPLVMGLDGAGVVVDADDASTLRRGQRVVIHPALGCGRCEFCRRGEHVLCTRMKFLGEHVDGTLADFVSVPEGNVFAAPEPLDDAEAAALCVAPITAWRMVFTKAALKPHETVLIFGIGGAVSLAALQFARMIGARVLVTSRDRDKLDRALALGAAVAIDTAGEDVVARVMAETGGRGVDVVIENVGAAVWPLAMKSVVRGGRIVTCGATTGDAPSADLRRLFIRQIAVFGSTHGTFSEFADMLAAAERGLFRPVIDSRHGFEDIHAAFDLLDSGRQFGKVALSIAEA